MDPRARAQALRDVLTPAARAHGVQIHDVMVHPAGKRRLVRVLLVRDLAGMAADDHTSPVPPLSLDEVAEVTRAVSQALDSSDVMGQAAYTLEVSSAGVDQPLVDGADFRRAVGRLVSVRHGEGDSTEGRLSAARADAIQLDGGPWLPLSSVIRGSVQVEFSRPDGKES